jgi:hypothetical protein
MEKLSILVLFIAFLPDIGKSYCPLRYHSSFSTIIVISNLYLIRLESLETRSHSPMGVAVTSHILHLL